MDVVLRLRVLIWVLLLSLWGVMVYQYLGEEETGQERMRQVVNPYRNLPPQPAPAPEELPPQSPAGTPGGASIAMAPPASSLGEIRAPGSIQSPLPPDLGTRKPPAQPREREAPAPAGFTKRSTRHFTVYAEGAPPSEEFLDLLENLHANLMLDLDSFSPWAKDDRVLIFLFQDQDAYRRMTGRPAWSGGASSVPKRRIYLYESAELPGILAHELCHIYYDSFFADGRPNPLWLSEGTATLIQIERGLAAPTWLRENLEILERGGGYSLEELISVTSTAGASDAKVRLWYAQSYSVVRFLIRAQRKPSFYQFSRCLREGRSVTEALYRSYGMPYNRLKALEYAWRYEIGAKRRSRPAAEPARP